MMYLFFYDFFSSGATNSRKKASPTTQQPIKTKNMKLEQLRLNEGKKLLLGISLCVTAFFALNGCTKDSLRIKPIPDTKADQNHPDIDPVNPKDSLPCGNFRTQTQGGWGATPHGNNPGSYLHSHFAAAFPTGLIVGCTYKLTFTSAQAITDYLPGGGPAAVLTANRTNPVNLKNNLASQLVTLTLSIQFDASDPNFSGSSVLLGNLLVGSGPFKGMKLKDIVAEGNKVLGGCPSNYTASQLVDVLTAINENFDDGTANGGFIVCPDKIIVISRP
jgi:hypothetical protein